jgi:outer membrane immunogenic protein
MNKLVYGAAIAVVALGSPVFAADMPTKAPAAAPPVATWAGCYVGGNAGAVWSHAGFDWSANPAAFGGTDVLNAYGSNNLDRWGGTAGIQYGCNFQSGPIVFGYESDIEWTGINKTVDRFFPTNGIIVPEAFSEHVKSQWLTTSRIRAGYLITPSVLLYATGGMAFAKVKVEDSVTFFNGAGVATAVNAVSQSKNRFGWTLGAGAEWMFAPNWTAKIEYLHVDLGSFSDVSYNLNLASGVVNTNGFIAHHHRVTEDIARVGVNYKFGNLFALLGASN